MAEYVNYLRVFGAPGAARALFGAIQDDTAGLGSVDLNRITPMPVWMREEPLSAGTVRRQGGENCWLDWRQANWGTRWNTLKAQASAAAYDGGDTILFYTQDAGADAARVPALSGRRPALRLGQPGCWYGLRRRAVQGRRNTGANMSAAGKQASV